LEQQLARRENAESLIARGAQRTPENPEELDRWYGRWARRWAEACREVEFFRALSGPIDSAVVSPNGQLPWERLSSDVAERLRRAELPGVLSGARPPADGLAPLWLRTVERAAPAGRWAGEEGSTAITLRFGVVERSGHAHRWMVAAGWMGLMLFTLLGLRCGLFAPLSGRWPRLLGVLGGLAWWLWLWPSLVGWGVVLASLAGSFRWGWGPPRQVGSGIITLSLGKR
jgi:hypothetical protein